MNIVFAMIVIMVTNISFHEVCHDIVNKLFVTRVFLVKRTLIFSVF